MENPLYLLMGAGVLIVIVALLMKKQRGQNVDQTSQLAQKQWDRAEMEKTLQRFVQQIKQQNEAVQSDLRRANSQLAQEAANLRQRLEKNEQELAQLAKLVNALRSSGTPLANQQESAEPRKPDEDILALRERYRRVFELQQEGLHIDEIAKRLGAGRGEIELIFSLAAPHERGTSDG